MCRCFQQWSVEHSHTRRSGCRRSRLERHVKFDVLCGQRWSPEQQPGMKSGHMLHLLCHEGSLGTVCLQLNSDHVCLWPSYHLHHDTAKHGYSGVMEESTGELDGALLSSVMTVGSIQFYLGICMRVIDVCVYGVDLVSVIFRSAFTHDLQGPLQMS